MCLRSFALLLSVYASLLLLPIVETASDRNVPNFRSKGETRLRAFVRGRVDSAASTDAQNLYSKIVDQQQPTELKRSPRFMEEKQGQESQMKAIGACNCEWPPKNFNDFEGDCAPQTVLCRFCMDAVYAKYWMPSLTGGDASKVSKSMCTHYLGKSKELCENIAKSVAAEEDIGEMYTAFGTNFAASGEYCRKGGCCPGMSTTI